MSNNKGQIKIGQSGPIVIGKERHEASIKAKVGNSGPIVKKENIIKIQKKKKPKKVKLKEKQKKPKKEKLTKEKSIISEVEEGPIIIKFSRKIDEFNVLVCNNKASGMFWYHGLEGNWWWGMTEDQARMKLQEQMLEDRKTEDIQKIEEEIEDVQEIEDIQKVDVQEIEDIQKVDDQEIEDIQKVDDQDNPIPEIQIRTISDLIDQMTNQYSRELPKYSGKRISYIYPLNSNHSFNIVAKNHIKYLKDKYLEDNEYIEIIEIDWPQLSIINWDEKRNVLIHPFLYPFASIESFIQNSKSFARLLAMKNKIGGFDVADSDKISKPAVDLINKIDLMIVPSNFAKDAFVKSGVTIPVEVLPHGVSDKFLNDDLTETDNEKIIKLRKMKKKDKILILYFLIHSSHRKGADLVKRVMKRVQKKFDNVYLIIRSTDCAYFSEIRSICIDSWLSDDDLIALYDTCDICISPSRGGGFELNALEAISRGVPTLVPNGCCFLDLIDYYIPIDLSNKTSQPLPGNPIHTGFGCEVDINDFEAKLTDTINRLDYWKGRFRGNITEIREKYSWRNTAKILDKHLRNHGFIE